MLNQSILPLRKFPKWFSYFNVPRDVIEYVSGACGSRKTSSAIEKISKRAYGHILYVVPTIDLARQVEQMMNARGLLPIVIASDNHARVTAAITSRINHPRDDDDIVIITWNAYAKLRYFYARHKNDSTTDFDNASHWTIIIDEIPQFDDFHELIIPKHPELLKEHLVLVQLKDGIGIFDLVNRSHTKELLDGVRDDVDRVTRDLIEQVYSSNYHVYGDTESWTRIFEKGEVGKTDESNTFYALSILNRTLFEGCILMGANVDTSMLKKYLDDRGAKFRECRLISELLHEPKQYGSQVEINYCLETTRISKNFGNKSDDDGRSNLDQIDELAAAHLGQKSFIYACNNDRKGISPSIDVLPNKKDIAVVCHGLNEYSDYNNVYISPSLNRSSKHFKMLKILGLEIEDVQRATAYETYYQIAMRTSLRDVNSDRPVTIIVPDKFIADHLAAQLGTTNVRKLGSIKEKPRKRAYSPLEKRRRKESKYRWEELFFRKTTPDTLLKDFGVDSGKSLDNMNSNSGNIFMTFHDTLYDAESDQFTIVHEPVQEFIQFMKSESTCIVENKERYMFNSGIYEPPTGADGFRRQDYFKKSSCMILDFDNGQLSPEHFIDIFGEKAPKPQRRSFIIYNSFSRSPDQPNRFRVVMFYSRPVSSISEHKAIYNWMVTVLEKAGFPPETSGLDKQCGSGNQSFFMPCTNRLQKEHWFFGTHWTRARELQLYAINPDDCIALMDDNRPVYTNQIVPKVITPESRRKMDKILSELQDATDGRNHLGIVAVTTLAGMGIPDHEIERELRSRSANDAKMKKRIPGWMKSLRKYQPEWGQVVGHENVGELPPQN